MKSNPREWTNAMDKITCQRREIRRLRRALWKIRAKSERHPPGTLKTWLPHCNCAECIATRALKGKIK